MPIVHLCHLFISPGHSFFGHQGQSAGEHLIVAVEQIECVAGRGIRGDRFFDYKPDYRGQITFFAMEVIEAMGRELGLAEVRPECTRRNVFTRGADLSALVGLEFEIQGVRFAGADDVRASPSSGRSLRCRHGRGAGARRPVGAPGGHLS